MELAFQGDQPITQHVEKEIVGVAFVEAARII